MKQIKSLTVTYDDGTTETWEGAGHVAVRSQESKLSKPYQMGVDAHIVMPPIELKKGV